MALTSRLAAAEDGLFAAIGARTNLAGVALRLGDPGSGARPEHIWIDETAFATQVSDLSSQSTPVGGREETFELTVRILATRSGDDYKALRDRATALALEVEEAVRTNRTLGSSVEDAEVVRIERETGASEVGRAMLTSVVVAARSWLGA